MAEPKEKEAHPLGVEDVTTDDLMAVPAAFVNRFYFTGMGANTRLAFGEQGAPKSKTKIRSAVVMTTADALQLRDLLVQMLSGVQFVEAERAEPNG